ncbi:MAG: cytochrome C oxidase subunit IV family protein, partial [Phycisphaerales bacterium JB040]
CALPIFLFAMVIASIKALLVCLYFMHLRYDKPFHALVFISGLAFALLFIGFSYMDTYQYQGDLDEVNTVPYEDAPSLYDHGEEGQGDGGH